MRALLLASILLVACGGDDGRDVDLRGDVDLAGADLAGAPTGDLAPASDLAGLPPVRFRITFDYRYDTAGFFTDPARRHCLEETAKIWGRLVGSDFPTVPAGTALKVRDPEHPTDPAVDLVAPADIDDLLVFVGSATFDGPGGSLARSNHTGGLSTVSDPTLAAQLDARYHGATFQPWVAWISFDPAEPWVFDDDPATTEPVPAGKLDFVSVALHELGHTLGLGTADAWFAKVSAQIFTGAAATAAYAAPVPLIADGTHVVSGSMSGGQLILMVASKPHDQRYLPTAVDLALLKDLGYQP